MHFDVFCSGVKHGVARERDILLILSLKMRIGSVMGTPRSFRIRLSHTASHAATVAPLYSASVLDITGALGCM